MARQSWILTFVFLCLSAASGRAVAPQFLTASQVGPATETVLAVGDLDGDGRPDILISNYVFNGPPQLGILFNNGNGSFTKKLIQPQLNTYGAVRIADVNDDGIADLIVVTPGPMGRPSDPIGYGTLQIYLGKGNATFEPGWSALIGAIDAAFVVHDFDRDGKPDIAVATTAQFNNVGGLQIFLNQGHGTFSQKVQYPQYTDVSGSADFNGDGKADLISGNQILLGNGNGMFNPGPRLPVTGSIVKYGIADVNRDGKLDIVALGLPDATVLLGTGDGTFVASSRINIAFPGHSNFASPGRYISQPEDLYIGDFNRDGHLDLAVASFALDSATPNEIGAFGFTVLTTGELAVYEGRGDGTFGSGSFYAGGGLSPAPALSAGDFTGDGNIDLLTSDMTLFRGSRNGIFKASGNTISTTPYSMVTADFNGDKIPDLAVVNQAVCSGGVNCSSLHGSVSIFFGTGKGYFQAGNVYPIELPQGTLAVGDINGDGKLDLVVTRSKFDSFQPASVGVDASILIGKGNGSFQPARNVTLLGQPLQECNTAYLADMNNDGRLDLVGDWGVALGKGDGTFARPIPYPGFSRDNTFSVAIGDFNGDGKLDVALGQVATGNFSTPGINVLLGKGDGSFTPRQEITNMEQYALTGVIVADVNKDGKPDLVYLSGYNIPNSSIVASNDVVVALGKGDGTFSSPILNKTTNLGAGLVVADFDRDGTLDVAVSNAFFSNGITRSQVTLLHGKGDGRFIADPDVYVSQAFSSLLAIDINGDHAPDIVSLTPIGVERMLNTGIRR